MKYSKYKIDENRTFKKWIGFETIQLKTIYKCLCPIEIENAYQKKGVYKKSINENRFHKICSFLTFDYEEKWLPDKQYFKDKLFQEALSRSSYIHSI